MWFGSKSVEYSQKTMEKALKQVEKMSANLGGTEILRPLKDIYSQPCIPNQPRQVNTHAHTQDLGGEWEKKRCFSSVKLLPLLVLTTIAHIFLWAFHFIKV